jgi:cytochrome c oxidase subunit 1
MSATAQTPQTGVPQIATSEVAKPSPRQRWVSWFTTTDHKRIGILYIVTTFAFFVVGGAEAVMMRLQLGVANNTLITPVHYNQLFTMHGSTMMFLFLTPMIAGLGSYLVPLQIGARNVAFPRLNALSYWLLLAGGVTLYATLFFTPPEAGWTSYPPLSNQIFSPSAVQDAWIYLFLLTGLSAILSAVNLIATVINNRAPGLTWAKVPAFTWSLLTYSVLAIISLPVAAAAAVMLLFDRNYGTSFFNDTSGGSPSLYQNLFWFFGQPQSYMAVIPAFGIAIEVLAVFGRKANTSQKAVTQAFVAVAGLSLVTWGSNMFTMPESAEIRTLFTILALLTLIPIAVLVGACLKALSNASIVTSSPLFYAAGFVGVFVFGAVSGIFMQIFPIAWQVSDSYFMVAQFHYTVAAAGIFGVLAALHFWYPKFTGRMVNEKIAKASFWLIFIGFNLAFLIQNSLGLEGMPRRIYEYGTGTGWQAENMISTAGSLVLSVGILLAAFNFVRSLTHGAKAGPDPWNGNTLEWFTPSPPPANNFDSIPAVQSLEPMKDIRSELQSSNAGS